MHVNFSALFFYVLKYFPCFLVFSLFFIIDNGQILPWFWNIHLFFLNIQTITTYQYTAKDYAKERHVVSPILNVFTL